MIEDVSREGNIRFVDGMVNALRLFLSRISWLGLLSVNGEKLVAVPIMS